MKAVIFDLDNTLFDVEQYFSGAFYDVADYLSKKHNIPKEKTHSQLMAIWKKKTSMYAHIFDDLLSELNLQKELKNVIKTFNNYSKDIKPYPEVISTLKELVREGFKLGIVTDGTVERQKRKIQQLGIDSFFEVKIYTKEIGHSKKSGIPFQIAVDQLSVSPEKSFYVGDNPHIDFEGAKTIGMKTIRLVMGEFGKVPRDEYIDYEINEFKKLLDIVKKV